MQLHTVSRSASNFSEGNRKNFPQQSTVEVSSADSRSIIDEIKAYVAIRDMRIATAEQATTAENLRLASIANDFVENCLARPQLVYAAQSLAESSAAFERQRCAIINARIAELRRSVG